MVRVHPVTSSFPDVILWAGNRYDGEGHNGRVKLPVERLSQGSSTLNAVDRVEEGAVVERRFPSPLIKPDVPISGFRLSDWSHRIAFGGGPT